MNRGAGSPFESKLPHRTVGITGGVGALAYYLIGALADHGVEKIVIFDKRAPCLPSGWPEVPVDLVTIAGDVLSLEECRKAFEGCEFIFHLAAQTHVGRSHSEPLECLRVNIQGTVNVLEACRINGIRGILYTSTMHVYGSPRQLPIPEDHPTVPLSIYAASKLAGEAAVRGYRAEFGINTLVGRLSNVYGARFGTDTVVGRALDQVMKRVPITLKSFAPVRDFIYARDVAEALVALAFLGQADDHPGVFNVSSGHGVSVGDMAHLLDDVAARVGLGGRGCIETGGEDPVPVMVADPSRLKRMTGWAPKYDLGAGLERSLRDLLSEGDEVHG